MLSLLADRFGLSKASPMLALAFYAICFSLGAINSVPFLMRRVGPSDVFARQKYVYSEINRVLDSDDAVFDRVGLYFRPTGHWQYAFNVYQLNRLVEGNAHFAEFEGMLREREVVAIGLTGRTVHMIQIRDEFREFTDEHFVYYGGNLLLQGRQLKNVAMGESQQFVALKEKEMEFTGQGAIMLDGSPFTKGVVSKGEHTITGAAPTANGRLMIVVPRPFIPQPPYPLPLFQGE
jgi:hypothetical protein